MWFNVAAAQGSELGRKYRNKLSNKMDLNDISKAQTLARICMEKNYKNCE